MGQEHTSLSETAHSHIMPSTIGDSNGVSTGLHAQARAQTDALPELTTEELVRYDRHLLSHTASMKSALRTTSSCIARWAAAVRRRTRYCSKPGIRRLKTSKAAFSHGLIRLIAPCRSTNSSCIHER